jgi:hypothetical protein
VTHSWRYGKLLKRYRITRPAGGVLDPVAYTLTNAGVVSTRRYVGRATCGRWERLDRISVSTVATKITSSRSGASRAS